MRPTETFTLRQPPHPETDAWLRDAIRRERERATSPYRDAALRAKPEATPTPAAMLRDIAADLRTRLVLGDFDECAAHVQTDMAGLPLALEKIADAIGVPVP